MKDGGVYVFCRYSHLAEKMNAVMERLIAVCSADEKADRRFGEAVRAYRKAYSILFYFFIIAYPFLFLMRIVIIKMLSG